MNRIFYSAYVLYVVATVLQSTMFTEYTLLARVICYHAIYIFWSSRSKNCSRPI